MDQVYFVLRAIRKVTTEIGLTILSYNMKRVINIRGVEKMITSMHETSAWST